MGEARHAYVKSPVYSSQFRCELKTVLKNKISNLKRSSARDRPPLRCSAKKRPKTNRGTDTENKKIKIKTK